MEDLGDIERVLVGCTLPPKVPGVPRCAVLLSVPHVLPSATTDAAAERSRGSANASAIGTGGGTFVPRLPAAPLVRVRWWGEDRPGSTLFRPTRITHEQVMTTTRRDDADAKEDEEEAEADSGDSSIRMRYPVCVPLEQLLDYLRDMKELVFDVVDRATRKKIGRSVFPFPFDASGAVGAAAEQAAAALRRANVLCEIHSTVGAAVVLGYLTVNFEIEWTAMADVTTPLKWASTAGMAPAVSVNPNQTLGIVERETERMVQQRLSFSSISSSSTLSGFQRQAPWRRAAEEAGVTLTTSLLPHEGQLAGGSGRLENLLEKGRALERSMSKAVSDQAVVSSSPTLPVIDTAESAPSPVSMMMLMAPYEAMTEELDNSWERVLEDAEKIQGPSRDGRVHIHDAVSSMRQELDGVGVSLGSHNALEISFESMELEQEMMDRLRQLREGSVSTRFSPIQLVVSHEHPKRLLKQHANSSEHDHWIAAFAVNSSLRKRHWRTNYTHTLPLLPSGSHQARGDSNQTIQVNQRVLKFRVRCKPQHASPTGTRKRGRATQILDLTADVPVKDLFDHRDRAWVLSLPLRIAHGVPGSTNDRSNAKRTAIVGTITVKFRFCKLPDIPEEGNDQMSEDVASSTWSRVEQDRERPTEHRDHESVNAIRHVTAPSNTSHKNPHRLGPGEVGTQLFFGLLIGRTLVRRESDAKPTKTEGGRQITPRLSVRVDYGTPAFFARSAKALRLKRSAKASLRVVDNERLKANIRHMNAFPLDVSDEFFQKLEHGLLILEVWIQEQSAALKSYVTEKLIGVVKIPLHTFAACTRDSKAITGCLVYAIPHIGVDQDFPIVDPLDDQINGQVHVRMAFGSAEQMFNWKSTLAAVIKLQAAIRGWQTRRAIAYWKRFELTRFEDDHQELQVVARTSDQVTDDFEQHRDGSPSAITGHSDAAASDPPVACGSVAEPHADRITRIEIRVEVRQSYATAAREGIPFIGCEVYGHLRFNDRNDGNSAPSASGPRFTLWWDANEGHLNSYFVHTLEASTSSTGIQLRDVMLLFRIEPQLSTAAKQAQDNLLAGLKGGAGVDLASVVSEDWRNRNASGPSSSAVEILEDIDLPIEWGLFGAETRSQGFAETLPLRIGMRITHGNAQDVDRFAMNGITEEDETSMSDVHNVEEVTTIQTVSRTERLLPASLHLSLDIQRISDLRDMIQEQLAAASRRSDSERTVRTLERAMQRGSVAMKIAMSLCLGVELHPEESSRNGDDIVFQDGHNQWHKRFRFEHIQLDLVNEVQAFPSITQGDVHVVVHPELVAFLQEGSLDMQLLVCDEDGDVPAGVVSVPVSAILFRPSGVQGSFPVRIDNVLAGRVGVHLCIDQDETPNRPLSNKSVDSFAEPGEQHVEDEPASPISASFTAVEERVAEESQEQTLEQAVASIHEAAQQIQQRLARLTTQSHLSETEDHDSDRVSVTSFPDERTEKTPALLSTSPTSPTSVPSAIQSPRANYPRHTDDDEDSFVDDHGSDQVQRASTNDGSESGRVVISGTHDDYDAFMPITLASFGIEELELSPIIEANSPKFEEGNESMESSQDSDADGSTLLRDAEESSETGTDNRHEGVHDDYNSDTAEELESLSGESEVSDKCDVAIDSNMSEHCSPVRASADLADEGTSVTAGVCHDLEQDSTGNEQLDATLDEADAMNVGSTVEIDPSEIFQAEPASKSITVEESVSNDAHVLSVEDKHDIDESGSLIDQDVVAIEVDPGLTAGADAVLSLDDLPAASQEMQKEDHTVKDSIVSEEPPLAEADKETPVQDLHPQRGRIVVCESSTQTPGEDLAESTTSIPNESSLALADTSPITVDSSCQTTPDSVQDATENDMEAVSSFSESIADSMANSQTQECEEDSSAMIDLPPDLLINEVGTSPQHVEDVRHVLPAEKFKIAWQLLNEIRALYVDPNATDPSALASSAAEETEASGLTAQDMRTNRVAFMETTAQPATRRPDSAGVANKPEHTPNGRVEGGDEHDHGGFMGTVPVPISASTVTWHWRDAESLKAEVEERLQASKREYEEALALSQSIHSMKSWSITSQLSTTQEMAAGWDEKAQELSASALAKRQSNARTHTLFRVDTETERIARIMQGSMRHWLHEDEDDDDSDGDTSEDDADLVDNYF